MLDLPTPEAVLEDWIGAAGEDPAAAAEKNQLWFVKSFATDRYLAETYLPLLGALASGLAHEWVTRGPRARLAAIIVLDQFSRNIFRGHALSFRHDAMALGLVKEGLLQEHDMSLSEAERIFFYLPLEHSERMVDQNLSVSQFARLAREARPAFKTLCDNTLAYAHKHREVIESFGRFPHRNAILKRPNTPDEQAYLAQPGAGF